MTAQNNVEHAVVNKIADMPSTVTTPLLWRGSPPGSLGASGGEGDWGHRG